MAGAAVTAAILGAAPANAAQAYMGGLFGSTPYYSTITGPNGERVNTGWTIFGGDERVSWNNISQQSAVNAQIKWLEKHQGEQNTLWVYSATANSINKVAATRPELLANTTVIAIAPPRAGSLDYAPVPTPSTFRQYQIIVDGDSVADEDGTSFSTHTNGYRNLNMQTATPISSSVTPGTNTTRSYYQRPGASSKSSTVVEPAPAKLTWAEKVAQSRAKRAERAAAAKVARAERREASQARWDRFVSKLRGEDVKKSDTAKDDTEKSEASDGNDDGGSASASE